MRINLAGYQIGELIYDGTRTLVYRGVKLDDSQPVILKKLRKEYPTFNELLQFRHQYVLSKNLDLPGIVKPITLEQDGNGYVLVMEDIGGVSLSEYYSDFLNLDEFFNVGLALCQILEQLYQNGVIHKDIKPDNILINPETKEIFLIDFSIASLLPRETGQLQNPNVLEGTLAYISPEQTGRMNRGIDYRSDFYGLGVTFYELLTGQLPFASKDPMELVHCQIALIPEPPHLLKADIPQVLSQIAMKLMAKNAEERYQSALGLKFDLEKCMTMWQETGSIQTFELGERDISDRFIIPEKLYGREAEVKTLLDAFGRVADGKTEMMLVAGFSGIGKTAVVNEVHKPIVRARGYFIKGKFDQFQRNIPYFALVVAFRDLMEQLLGESDSRLEAWKTAILNALGENSQAIVEVIPELESLIGKQPPVPELSGSAAQNRFNLLFQKFIRVFASPDHPLVIFVDDLQWADSSSLKLMELLMGDANMGYLLFLGAYRDNEVFPTHPLMLTLDEIGKSGASLNTITLAPLSQPELDRLVADTLNCSQQLALPLSELVYQKTEGNPFFATQFLKSLYEDGWIAFNFSLGYWQCDMTRVRELALSSDVVEFVATRLHKLPKETRSILKLAACIGNQFDLETLAVVSEQSQTEAATNLWVALQEGLILPLSETYKFYQQEDTNSPPITHPLNPLQNPLPNYKFLHDRVQQAAYSLISENDRQATHLKIGRLLLPNYLVEPKNNIFTIVNQFNSGLELVTDCSEKYQIAELNVFAAQKAKASTAYKGAVNYTNTGLKLLDSNSWKNNYNLALKVYIQAVEIEYLNANFDGSEKLALAALQNAANLLDRVKISQLQIQSYVAQLRLDDVISTGLKVLQELGVNLSEYSQDIAICFQAIENQLKAENKQLQDLTNLPEMTDPYKLATMEILWSVTSTAYIGNPALMPQLLLATIDLCVKYGNPPIAASVYVNFGVCLIVSKDIETGYKFGQLALVLLEKVNLRTIVPTVLQLFNAFVRHWKDSVKETIEPLLTAFNLGLETGNFEYASYACICYNHHSFWAGINLEIIAKKCQIYLLAMADLKQDYALYFLQMTQQMLSVLLGKTEEKYRLIGTYFNEEELFPEWEETNNLMTLFFGYVFKTIITYLLGNYEGAIANAKTAEKYKGVGAAMMVTGEHNFYYSLSLLACCLKVNSWEKNEYLEILKTNQADLQFWAETAPNNYQHKYQLVEAEKARVLGNRLEAIELYDKAIATAKENEFIQEEALANELAAKFYLEWGKEKVAAGYMQEAYYCYARWGAKAKVEDLETRYRALLTPILERQKIGLTPTATLATLTAGTISKTTAGIGEMLDFAALMKASRVLSEDIELESAIANLMQVARENAGAETVALILFEDGVLMLTALLSGLDAPKIDPIPVEASNAVPMSIVNQVKRRRKPLVLENASNETAYAVDAYIQKHQPQSILCLPLIDRGKLRGLLYLENNRVAGAFTSDRVEILSLLCSQAAISLENARLYGDARNYAQQLEDTQLQLVQSEKMATMGQLVSGVAHEINNPIGFISGNLDYASEYIQNLIELLQLYQQGFDWNSETTQNKIEEIELDYLLEDFPQLISSMKGGTKRIAEISKSMRTFSRSDTAAKVPFNIHDGIDSTLLILKHRLKANQKRPEIEAVKNYGNLPSIECYPGQLNQVFMNILANAIDVFDEGNIGRNFEEIKADPNRIAITTEIDGEKQEAIVRIADNGPGMPEQVKQKIFEHLFTTKEVGKGTGLGLSISRQIVVEKHGGRITCSSELGRGTQFAIALPLK